MDPQDQGAREAGDADAFRRDKLETVSLLVAERDELNTRLDEIRDDLDAACIAARDAGASWDQIAALLGLSGPALQERLAG